MLVFSGNGAHDHTFFRPVRARMMHRTRSSTKNRIVISQDRAVLARRLCIAYLHLDHRVLKGLSQTVYRGRDQGPCRCRVRCRMLPPT